MPSRTERFALIIPALNEAESIGRQLGQLPRGLFAQIIVVDNGSVDATAEVAHAAGAQVVQERRRGYGQACQTGWAPPSGDYRRGFHGCGPFRRSG